jgi:hypothetical protein
VRGPFDCGRQVREYSSYGRRQPHRPLRFRGEPGEGPLCSLSMSDKSPTSRQALSEAQLNSLLLRVQDRFSWSRTADRYELAGERPIRSGVVYRCRASGESSFEIAVKVGEGWSPAVAQGMYEQARLISRAWPRDSEAQLVPVLGWEAAPPTICMPFVEGDPIQRVLRSSVRVGGAARVVSRPYTISECLVLVSKCGETLGLFHSNFMGSPETSKEQAEWSFDRAAKRTRAPRRIADRVKNGIPLCRSYVDFSPPNILVEARRRLRLIDPPPREVFEYVHKDAAHFLLGLQLIEIPESRSRPEIRAHIDPLREAFLDGYAKTGPQDLRTQENRWVLTIYEGYRASNVAYRSWRRGRRRWALRHTALWFYAFMHLRRDPAGRGSIGS